MYYTLDRQQTEETNMPRRRCPPAFNRTVIFSIRFTPIEMQTIRSAAHNLGISTSKYIRRVLLDDYDCPGRR